MKTYDTTIKTINAKDLTKEERERLNLETMNEDILYPVKDLITYGFNIDTNDKYVLIKAHKVTYEFYVVMGPIIDVTKKVYETNTLDMRDILDIAKKANELLNDTYGKLIKFLNTIDAEPVNGKFTNGSYFGYSIAVKFDGKILIHNSCETRIQTASHIGEIVGALYDNFIYDKYDTSNEFGEVMRKLVEHNN